MCNLGSEDVILMHDPRVTLIEYYSERIVRSCLQVPVVNHYCNTTSSSRYLYVLLVVVVVVVGCL
jgi:hypothetical protein